jgi:hypothetical protein
MEFTHAEYLTATGSDSSRKTMSPGQRNELLRAESYLQVLQHGQRIYGTVVGEQGRPVEAATVMMGEYVSSRNPVVKTGPDGRFDIRNAESKPQVLTVTADGYAPLLKEVAVDEFGQEQIFALDRGHVLKGVLVDINDVPVHGAKMSVWAWRGHSTIENAIDVNEDGEFEWKTAPSGKIELFATAKGYRERRARNLLADGIPKRLVMRPSIVVRGTVVAGDSNEPVKRFKLVPGVAWGGPEGMNFDFRDNADEVKIFEDGKYEYEFTRAGRKFVVKIVADGYPDALSRELDPNDRNTVCNFKLERYGSVRGHVLLSDGKPAAGVTVQMFPKDRNIWMQDDRLQEGQVLRSAKTDPNGLFMLEEPAAEYQVAAIASAGLAVVTAQELRREGRMTLTPWGRVEGEYYRGSGPAAATELTLSYDSGTEPVAIYGLLTVSTDQQGRFVFARVRPGGATVGEYHVEVQAGRTTHISMGGGGRTVRMELVLPEGDYKIVPVRSFDLSIMPQHDNMDDIVQRLPFPARAETMSAAELEQWLQDFVSSDEGRRLMEKLETGSMGGRRYIRVTMDGTTAVIEDLPAGRYVLEGQVMPAKADGNVDWEKPVAQVYYEFEVPTIREGDMDIPLDLGKVKVAPRPASIQDMELDALDGQRIRVADYKGKVVLAIACYGTQLKDSPEVANLKRIYEQYKGDPGLVMIGMVPSSSSFPITRAVMREAALPWPQGYTGWRASTRLIRSFQIDGTGVSTILIGRDGEVAATGLKGEELAAKIEELMLPTPEGNK